MLTGLFPVDVPRGRGDKNGHNFYNARPQKFVTAKNRPKFCAIFLQLSTLIANISGTDPKIENRKSH